MFNKRKKNKKNVDFLLQSSHYRKLHLYLYFISLGIILGVYFLIVTIFADSSITVIVTSIVSFLLGIYLVFNRDELVKKISEQIDFRKRKNIKKADKSNLRTTLRKITPRNKNLKLNIKSKISLKERIQKVKKKFIELNQDPKDKKKKEKPDYIEIK